MNYHKSNYRSFIGFPYEFDLHALNQMGILAHLGLREYHKVLDVGCGSLRLGRLLIPLLLSGNYYGIDPNKNLILEGFKYELGFDIQNIKKPNFSYASDFSVDKFGVYFSYIIAQSVFTHTSYELAVYALKQLKKVMNADTVLVASFIENYKSCENIAPGWSYPKCISYSISDIKKIFNEAGLYAKQFNYPHPRQNWWIAAKTWSLVNSL